MNGANHRHRLRLKLFYKNVDVRLVFIFAVEGGDVLGQFSLSLTGSRDISVKHGHADVPALFNAHGLTRKFRRPGHANVQYVARSYAIARIGGRGRARFGGNLIAANPAGWS